MVTNKALSKLIFFNEENGKELSLAKISRKISEHQYLVSWRELTRKLKFFKDGHDTIKLRIQTDTQPFHLGFTHLSGQLELQLTIAKGQYIKRVPCSELKALSTRMLKTHIAVSGNHLVFEWDQKQSTWQRFRQLYKYHDAGSNFEYGYFPNESFEITYDQIINKHQWALIKDPRIEILEFSLRELK
jgi:hypothetical protein